jgi:hypothetical protein
MTPEDYRNMKDPANWVEEKHHPKGNFWFVDKLEYGDNFYDEDRDMWGVFLQIPGMVVSVELGFTDPKDAATFIQDDILGAETE